MQIFTNGKRSFSLSWNFKVQCCRGKGILASQRKYLFCYLVNYIQAYTVKVIYKHYLWGCERIFRKKALFLTYCEHERQQKQCICNELYIFLVKVGTPTYDELGRLAYDIGFKWKRLGRVLGFLKPVLDEVDTQQEPLMEKGYRMLRQWKERLGAAASYKVLNGALRHESVQGQDLAETFCQGRDIMVIIIIFFYLRCVCCGLMVLNALDSGLSSLGLNPGRDQCH